MTIEEKTTGLCGTCKQPLGSAFACEPCLRDAGKLDLKRSALKGLSPVDLYSWDSGDGVVTHIFHQVTKGVVYPERPRTTLPFCEAGPSRYQVVRHVARYSKGLPQPVTEANLCRKCMGVLR